MVDVPLIVAAAIVGVAALLVALTVQLAAAGRIKRSPIGLQTTVSMRSEHQWQAVHRRARTTVWITAILCVATEIATLPVGSVMVRIGLTVFGAVLLTAGTVVGAVHGSRPA